MRKSLIKVAAGWLLVSVAACGGGDDPPKVETLRDVLIAIIEVGCEKADECDKLPAGMTVEDCRGNVDNIDAICNNTQIPVDCAAMLTEQQKEDAQACLEDTQDLACDAQGLPSSCPSVPNPQPGGV